MYSDSEEKVLNVRLVLEAVVKGVNVGILFMEAFMAVFMAV